MSHWLLNLPVVWMAVIIFAATYLVAGLIDWIVMRLAVGDRARAFKELSPGMLPPLGIMFGLLVGFIAAQVWSDFEKAKVAVANEASALRTINLLAADLPAEPRSTIRAIRLHDPSVVGKRRSAAAMGQGGAIEFGAPASYQT